MTSLARVAQVEPLGDLRLRLTFTDGLVRELDFEDALSGSLFDQLREPSYFSQVTVDPTTGTVTWPNEIDFDPDVLHGDHPPASGRGPRLISEHHQRAAG
jgi:Protein of unknown function (DUF2442)